MLTKIASIALASDTKGNLTEYEINGKEYEVDYDLDNRIIKVDVDNDDVEYRYDALGRRVIRQEGSTKTALIWWGNSECAEHKHQAGQTVIQNDIMAHPSRLNSVIARAVDGSKFKLEWYHKNYLDHVYAVSNDSGDILEHYRYTAFGEVQIYNASGNQVATTQIDNHILWNTRRRDELTGYYLYKFRHYSAELGRWLARDPIEESGGVNLYQFCYNSPYYWYDFLGMDPRRDWNRDPFGKPTPKTELFPPVPGLADLHPAGNTIWDIPWAQQGLIIELIKKDPKLLELDTNYKMGKLILAELNTIHIADSTLQELIPLAEAELKSQIKQLSTIKKVCLGSAYLYATYKVKDRVSYDHNIQLSKYVTFSAEAGVDKNKGKFWGVKVDVSLSF